MSPTATSSTGMRAYVCTPARPELRTVPEPQPARGEALVRVEAFSVNRGEHLPRSTPSIHEASMITQDPERNRTLVEAGRRGMPGASPGAIGSRDDERASPLAHSRCLLGAKVRASSLAVRSRSRSANSELVGRRAAHARFRQAKRQRGALLARRLDVVHTGRAKGGEPGARIECRAKAATVFRLGIP
jgi:hypothetical protein